MPSPSSPAFIVFAHGSRVEAANEAVRVVAIELARAGGFSQVVPAFLELGEPSLPGAARQLVERGVRQIVVLPYFLTPGLHLERDLPRLIAEISTQFNDLEISVTPSLDGHEGLVSVLLARAQESLNKT